jgi:hypothetical protein
MDLMKLIDDTNRATAVLDLEQWTVRGWPNSMAMFHKYNCRCCNEYVAHAIRTCTEQSIDLPMQAVSDAVTMAWQKLMHNLESEASTSSLADYKELADKAASLRAALKTSQAILASVCSRIDRWDKTICDLKDDIAALKHPQSTVFADNTVDMACSAIIMHRRAFLMPDGSSTDASPIRARYPDIKTRASISYRCAHKGRSFRQSVRRLCQ